MNEQLWDDITTEATSMIKSGFSDEYITKNLLDKYSGEVDNQDIYDAIASAWQAFE